MILIYINGYKFRDDRRVCQKGNKCMGIKHFTKELNMLDSLKLDFFKKSLEKQKRTLEENWNFVVNEISSSNEHAPKDEGDYASLSSDLHIGNALLAKKESDLKAIERALKRIEENCYGICELCQEPIGIERLKVKMFADYCISCKELVERY